MDEHLVALEKRMQQLQEAIRQALTQHNRSQVSFLGAELMRIRHAWMTLCGLNDDPDAAQSEPGPTAAKPDQSALASERNHQALTLLNPGEMLGVPSSC